VTNADDDDLSVTHEAPSIAELATARN